MFYLTCTFSVNHHHMRCQCLTPPHRVLTLIVHKFYIEVRVEGMSTCSRYTPPFLTRSQRTFFLALISDFLSRKSDYKTPDSKGKKTSQNPTSCSLSKGCVVYGNFCTKATNTKLHGNLCHTRTKLHASNTYVSHSQTFRGLLFLMRTV